MVTSSVVTASNSCILILADDVLAQQISMDLQAVGYICEKESNHTKLLSRFQELAPAMVVIDQSWANNSGLLCCRQLRNLGSRIPILILIEEEIVEERVACLEAGADDYILKPYNRESLLDLISLYLKTEVNFQEQLRFADLILDLTTRRVIKGGQPEGLAQKPRTIDLTMKEFELLKYLMSNPRKVLTREEIIENVWGYDYRGESNVIEVYIRYLRLKIETEGQKRLIQTVRGVGYVLREP
ncbi:two component transcriptional regulator, winged helix family [Stanieria cyanosphaera PCC 7437]|uniref:Two component transcriptional regulator, winged helix family n=1 Tax=Stanieria cyanosphaera (strain ATCC 29371 / PCC 7437) TaxID=111780 RepID=K9XMP4_STAC7|nr:response regulator transcription factor [Stanieria cyanosphaera]AFZ33768.1 two component transcriptional regulator, winged helix family [Stanieria cyanosphaera PCC 7437]